MLENRFVVSCERIARRKFYLVRFQYNEQLITRIKQLPEGTRKWSPKDMAWELSTTSLLALIKSFRNSEKIYFNFGSEESRKIFISQIKIIEIEEIEKKKLIDDLNANKENWLKYKLELDTTYINHIERLQTFLNDNIILYPHQVSCALFMDITKNTLVSHEMGLGKTISSILYVEMNDYQKVVVITPNSLKFNYLNEIEKFTKSKGHIVNWGKDGKKNKNTIEESKYIIVNYDYFNPNNYNKLITKWNKLDVGQIDVLICDEVQKLKSSDSNTYKNFKRIFTDEIFVNNKPSKIFLSGTPAPNRAHELFNVLHQISPLDFATKKYFQSYYCGMTYDFGTGWGYVTDTAEQKLEELYYKIAPYTHRKRKSEVLKDLPDKTYQKIMLELDNSDAKIYEEIEDGVANDFVLHPTNNPLTIMIRLRQFTSQSKIKPIVELIENILDTGEKIVVVDYFKDSLYKLKEILGDIAALHTGDQSVEERADIIANFQDMNSNIKIFLGSIQTCGYGITLTAASKLFIISLPYSIGEYDQVADRCHRIGQKNAVNIYPLIFTDTIDEYVYSAIESKRREIVKVMDNENYTSSVGESVISEVINKIKEKHNKK